MHCSERVWRERGLRDAALAGDEAAWRTLYEDAFATHYGYALWRPRLRRVVPFRRPAPARRRRPAPRLSESRKGPAEADPRQEVGGLPPRHGRAGIPPG